MQRLDMTEILLLGSTSDLHILGAFGVLQTQTILFVELLR